MPTQCLFCKVEPAVLQTHNGNPIGESCIIKRNMCEICGSTRRPGATEDQQLHYEEECFK